MRRIIAIVIAVVLLAACAVLVFAKPSRAGLTGLISETLISGAGDKYSQVYYDFGIFNITQGKNVKSGDSDTYMGFAGRAYNVNGGISQTAAKIILWMPALISGTGITISLTFCAVIAGLFLSIFLALGKISKHWILRWPCSAYIFFFRGSPLLMQLFFVYYALPVINPVLTINNKFLAAFVAFALNTGAYCAEIIRAAIQSIDKGQFEASQVLGLTYGQTMRMVIIPQSIRRLLPPVANEFIMILKDASLVSLIALSDLTHVTRSISSSTGSVLVYIPAVIIYLIITAIFSTVFRHLENRFSVYQ